MSTPDAAILIGLQGAGKSTFAHRHLGATHLRISRDTVRTAARERALHCACIGALQSFAADNTHPAPESRAPAIRLARGAGFTVTGYFFVPDLDGARDRNAARSGRAQVPEAAIRATLQKMTAPAFAEGFDRIFHVRLETGGERDGEFTLDEQPAPQAGGDDGLP